MVRRITHWQLAVALLFLAIFSGCKPSKPAGTVTGKVVMQGESVSAGTQVYFEQSSTGYIAAGTVQEDGTFSLKYQGKPLVPIGDYTVFLGPPETNMSEKEYYELKAKVNAEFRSRREKPPASPDWVYPAKFYLSSTSPLRQTVNDGENSFEISLDE